VFGALFFWFQEHGGGLRPGTRDTQPERGQSVIAAAVAISPNHLSRTLPQTPAISR
jgi:hypothetical protein